MATLKNKLETALAGKFKGANVKLTGFSPGKRVGGSLVWKGFVGMPQIDRQVTLREAIDKALAPSDQLALSFILTLTPDEFASVTKRN